MATIQKEMSRLADPVLGEPPYFSNDLFVVFYCLHVMDTVKKVNVLRVGQFRVLKRAGRVNKWPTLAV